MSKNEQICPTCGNGHTYHNCADLFHAPWKTNPPQQPAEPPAGAAGEDELTCNQCGGHPDSDRSVEGWVCACGGTFYLATPPPQPQGGTPEAKAIFDLLSICWHPETDTERFYAAKEGAQCAVEALERQRNEARAALAATQAEVERWRATAKTQDEEHARTLAELEQTRREVVILRDLHLTDEQRDQLIKEALTLRQALAATQAEVEGWNRLTTMLRAEIEQTRRELADEHERIIGLDAAVKQANAERDEAIARERQWLAELEVRRGHVAEAERHLRETREERDAARKDTARLDWLEQISATKGQKHLMDVTISHDHVGLEDDEWSVTAGDGPDPEIHEKGKGLRAAIDAALAAKTTEGGVRL